MYQMTCSSVSICVQRPLLCLVPLRLVYARLWYCLIALSSLFRSRALSFLTVFHVCLSVFLYVFFLFYLALCIYLICLFGNLICLFLC